MRTTGNCANLLRLDQRQRLGQLVQSAEPAGQDDERVRVLEEQHLAHEEVAAGDPPVEVRIGVLFEGQLDVAAYRDAARLARSTVGGFHHPGAAAGHHREAQPRHGGADFAAT